MNGPTLEELQARCDYWVNRLELDEWRGRTKVVFKSKKFMEDADGRMWWNAEQCMAEVWLRRGQGESTLLHELLHLTFEGHTTHVEGSYSEMQERAINRLVKGLMK